MRPLRTLVLAVCLLALAGLAPRAQMRVAPIDDEHGRVAVGLALRHLANTGTLMMATAHPDDENNGLLVMLNRGQGYRTTLATATRGNGGQNEIGPELFESLGVLRTEELAALHRFDGAEQYFTRAVDFGFSFSIEETLEKWGREEITADFVRLIRTIRPEVVVALPEEGAGGGQHHQASAILSREAFKLAGDPTKFPEQIAQGLRPWQPKKYYQLTGFGPPGEARDEKRLTINLAGYDPLLGQTYAEIGTAARSMHKCQGMAQLLSLPGPATTSYRLVETSSALAAQKVREERALFEGVDTTLGGLAQLAGPRPPKELIEGLAAVSAAVSSAQRKFETESLDAVVLPLLTGLRTVRAVRGQLRALGLDEAARFEIDFRLRQKEREFQQAILLANGVRIDALADDGVVVPGQPVRVSVLIANRGAADVTLRQVKFDGFDGDGACALTQVTAAAFGGGRGRGAAPPVGPPIALLRKDQVARCDPTFRVPADARVTEPYWHRAGEAGRYTFDPDAPFGLPYRPTSFYVQVSLSFPGSDEVFAGQAVQHRYEGNIFSGEKRSELLIVPALSVRVSPEVAIVPLAPMPPPVPPPAEKPAGRGTPATKTPKAGTPPTTPPAPGTPASPATATASAPQPPAAPAGRGGRGAKTPAVKAPPPPPPPVGEEREIRVTVVNDTKDAVESTVKLQMPEGWTSDPPEQVVAFAREDEAQTIRFRVRTPPGTAAGEYRLAASATVAERAYTRGYQVVEYPHIRRQHIYHDAATVLKVIDVKTAPNLSVGYIMGVGDEVPAALEQLGAKVQMIGPDDLAWGDLSRYGTIVTGVRAYERRPDLRAHNGRLIDYVRNGGTVIVQYNKFEFNEAQYGPYAAKVSSDRVTDERAPVTVLAPAEPVLNVPNRIGDAVWSNWVQERGLYFLGERDSRYRDLVAIEDPFPYNKGEKRGALVQADYGKGHWVYVGLALWRELPAGVVGAYQLLANLISLGH